MSREGGLAQTGKFGDQARRWKGAKASYAAKHMWLTKHFDKGEACEECGTTGASRLEWANLSGRYLRDRSDYKVLCPSCHRKMDTASPICRNGHTRTEQNTKHRANGWTVCRDCANESARKYRLRITA